MATAPQHAYHNYGEHLTANAATPNATTPNVGDPIDVKGADVDNHIGSVRPFIDVGHFVYEPVPSPARAMQDRLHSQLQESEQTFPVTPRAPLIYGIAFACMSSVVLWAGLFQLHDWIFGG